MVQMQDRKLWALTQIHPQIHKKMLKKTGSYLVLPFPLFPSCALSFRFLPDTSPELVMSELPLKRSGALESERPSHTPDSTTFPLWELGHMTCYMFHLFLYFSFLILYNSNYLYTTELSMRITYTHTRVHACVEPRASLGFMGCPFPSTFWKGGGRTGCVAKQCQLPWWQLTAPTR